MSQRSKATEVLSGYFEKKGDILNPVEYKKETDTPIRLGQVKRIYGNWSRMEKIVRAFDARNKNRPAPTTNSREIIAETNRLAAEKEELMRSIGEDVEQKTAREEAARAQIEADALNAATPEGARENKVRKGGPESVEAKTIKESVARAVATEHAMLAKTPQGAALGKELLGGVEDQDAKNLAIARENARTERSALLAATPEGAALAKMEEDDSDGKLTREAEVRIKNELRPYVQPATEDNIGEIVADNAKLVRTDLRETIEEMKTDDAVSIGAATRGDLFYAKAGVDTIVTEGDLDKAPPADRIPDPAVLVNATDDKDFEKKTGISADSMDAFGETEEKEDTATADADAKKTLANVSPTAKENKDTVNLEQNKDNPEVPPADRNPDPAFLKAAEPEKKTPEKK